MENNQLEMEEKPLALFIPVGIGYGEDGNKSLAETLFFLMMIQNLNAGWQQKKKVFVLFSQKKLNVQFNKNFGNKNNSDFVYEPFTGFSEPVFLTVENSRKIKYTL